MTWLTFDDTNGSLVEYGIDRLDKEAHGTTDYFVDGGAKQSMRYNHRVLLTGLEPGKKYR